MAENNNEMEMKKFVEEYEKQIELMKKQYGQEEDLYPWIYMLLMKSGKINKLSMRQVAGASWAECVRGRELLRGYAGFPDIVILDKTFCAINIDNEEDIKNKRDIVIKWLEERKESDVNKLKKLILLDKLKRGWKKEFRENWYKYNINKIKGCIEVKDISKILIDIKEDTVLSIDCSPDTYIEKYRIGNGNCCYQIEVDEENVNGLQLGKYIEIEYDDLSAEVKAESMFEQGKKISRKIERRINCCIKLNESKTGEIKEYDLNETDIKQLFGELLWYGKVLYTNGKEWKYIEVTKCSKEKEITTIAGLREILYADYVNIHKPEKEWYKCISELQDNGLEIQINCKIKSNEKDLMEWINENVKFEVS